MDVIEEIRLKVIATNRGISPSPEDAQKARSLSGSAYGVRFSNERRRVLLSYLAGIMDSDGYFKIERRKVKGMISPHYRIAIGAAQVVPSPAIELLARTFRGNVRLRQQKRNTQRPLATWRIYDRMAVPAIEALLPRLINKAPEARLLLRVRELKARGKLGLTEWVHANRWRRRVKMRKQCYTPEQVRELDRLYLTLKALHSGLPPYDMPG